MQLFGYVCVIKFTLGWVRAPLRSRRLATRFPEDIRIIHKETLIEE